MSCKAKAWPLLVAVVLLEFCGRNGVSAFGVTSPVQHAHFLLPRSTNQRNTLRRPASELNLFRRIRRIFGGERKTETIEETIAEISTESLGVPKDTPVKKVGKKRNDDNECISVCIVGGGVSGLSAAISSAKGLAKSQDSKVVVLEASSSVGGRVKSDVTEDGYTLDQGFAVFIEAYPEANKLLDYDQLKLGRFLPGALVKIRKSRTNFARVGDPLRDFGELIPSLFSPIGDIFDKLGAFSIVLNVKTKSIEELFEEKETSTLDALKERYKISNVMLDLGSLNRSSKEFIWPPWRNNLPECFLLFSKCLAMGLLRCQRGELEPCQSNSPVKQRMLELKSGLTLLLSRSHHKTMEL